MHQHTVDLRSVLADCSEPNWNGYGAVAVNNSTLDTATAFLKALPTWVAMPDFAADPDGEVALEWRATNEGLLAVSIAADGTISFIFRYAGDRARDTLKFDGQAVPKEIIVMLERLKN